jgi:transcriptional regulator with XRE-family HTH domain
MPGRYSLLMHYTQLFRKLREAKGLTLEALAKLARRHRNTVINVESGRPVKFKTIAELMVKMGYGTKSPEMKAVALLWLEAVSGIAFSQPETEGAARKAIAGYQASARQAARQLDEVVGRSSLDVGQIELLAFAARNPGVLAILQNIRALATDLSIVERAAEREVAEDS